MQHSGSGPACGSLPAGKGIGVEVQPAADGTLRLDPRTLEAIAGLVAEEIAG